MTSKHFKQGDLVEDIPTGDVLLIISKDTIPSKGGHIRFYICLKGAQKVAIPTEDLRLM